MAEDRSRRQPEGKGETDDEEGEDEDGISSRPRPGDASWVGYCDSGSGVPVPYRSNSRLTMAVPSTSAFSFPNATACGK
jgi:hypothetical protein